MQFDLEINLSGKIPSEMWVTLRYKLLTPLTLLSLLLLLTLCTRLTQPTLLTLLIHRFGAKGLTTSPAEVCGDLQKKTRGRLAEQLKKWELAELDWWGLGDVQDWRRNPPRNRLHS